MTSCGGDLWDAYLTQLEAVNPPVEVLAVDVHLPTTDGRELVLSRYTQPEADHRMLLELLHLKLPEQPPPKITAKLAKQHHQAVNARGLTIDKS